MGSEMCIRDSSIPVQGGQFVGLNSQSSLIQRAQVELGPGKTLVCCFLIPDQSGFVVWFRTETSLKNLADIGLGLRVPCLRRRHPDIQGGAVISSIELGIFTTSNTAVSGRRHDGSARSDVTALAESSDLAGQQAIHYLKVRDRRLGGRLLPQHRSYGSVYRHH